MTREKKANTRMLTRVQARLLIFFVANYTVAAAASGVTFPPQVIKKYGIDENGRSFEYTVTAVAPAGGTAAALPEKKGGQPQATVRYGIDEHGRSFVYGEHAVPSPAPAVTAPARPVAPVAAVPARTPALVAVRPVPALEKKPVAAVPSVAPAAKAPVKVAAPQPAPRPAEPVTVVAAPVKPVPVPVRAAVAAAVVTSQPKPAVVAKPAVISAKKVVVQQPQQVVKAAPHKQKAASIGTMERDLKQLGATTVRNRVVRQDRTVHRLLYAQHQDRTKAYSDLRILEKSGQRAYIISGKETHTVYCGAYFREGKAVAVQDDLARQGIRVSIRKEAVAVNRQVFVAEGFASREAAVRVSGTLKERGIDTKVIKAGQTYTLTSGDADNQG